jgi:hypothetical protein
LRCRTALEPGSQFETCAFGEDIFGQKMKCGCDNLDFSHSDVSKFGLRCLIFGPKALCQSHRNMQSFVMISYSLKCENDHSFDSWFASANAFDKLLAARMVTCTLCGTHNVKKAIMAPRVNKTTSAQSSAHDHVLAQSNAEMAIAQMRKHVEENSDYVGTSFAQEARKMHLGDAPERSIYGEAKPDEAKALIEDGINVVPLPFMTKQKTN